MTKSFFSFFLTLLFVSVFYNNTFAQVDIRQKEKVYTSVDRMPCFIECERNLKERDRRDCCDEQVKNYMLDHLKYPTVARDAELEGTVIIRFIVNREGKVVQPEIISDIGKGCGREALRVVQLMPRWETSGMQANRKVPVQFDLPVRFSLDEMDRPRGNASTEDIVKTAVIVGGFLFAIKKIMDKNEKKSSN